MLITSICFLMKILKRFITIILSFVLVINIFYNSFLPVSASGSSRPVEFQFPHGWSEYTLQEKKFFMLNDSEFLKLPVEEQIYYMDKYRVFSIGGMSNFENLLMYLTTNKLGVVARNGLTGLADAWNGAREQAYEQDIDILVKDNNGEVYLSDDYLSIFNEFLNEFVKANSPKFRTIDTTDLRTISATTYSTKDQWEKAIAFLNNHPNDVVAKSEENLNVNGTYKKVPCFYVISGEDILFYVEGNHSLKLGLIPYDNDWSSFTISNWGISTKWDYVSKYIWNENENNFTKAESCYFTPDNFIATYFNTGYIQTGGIYHYNSSVSFSYKNGKAMNVFDTREHAIQWITGQRDVYTTDKFNNYQSGNSIRITGDSLNNSNNTYNVINNAVNNYYQEGGSFSDADIAAIIAAILAELEGSGSGSGNTDITVSGGDLSGGISGGSSGGLSGFLDGIGAVLDAVLAIVGKLLEYVGKAIDLFSDVILKVIDIIPRGFTSFVTELMPFLPKEWLTAIELMLALSVILMIVNFFKK